MILSTGLELELNEYFNKIDVFSKKSGIFSYNSLPYNGIGCRGKKSLSMTFEVDRTEMPGVAALILLHIPSVISIAVVFLNLNNTFEWFWHVKLLLPLYQTAWF